MDRVEEATERMSDQVKLQMERVAWLLVAADNGNIAITWPVHIHL